MLILHEFDDSLSDDIDWKAWFKVDFDLVYFPYPLVTLKVALPQFMYVLHDLFLETFQFHLDLYISLHVLKEVLLFLHVLKFVYSLIQQ